MNNVKTGFADCTERITFIRMQYIRHPKEGA